MKKIECVFVRKYICETPYKISDEKFKGSKYLAIDEVNPGCEWVLKGEGIATIKYDGTAVMIDEELNCYQRFQAKPGKNQSIPDGAILVDEKSDRTLYWVPATDKWIKEAYAGCVYLVRPGTFEAIGPMINGNRHKEEKHTLKMHGNIGSHVPLEDLSYKGIRDFLKVWKTADYFYEGIVFHHPDGRMAKIKRSDFGFE